MREEIELSGRPALAGSRAHGPHFPLLPSPKPASALMRGEAWAANWQYRIHGATQGAWCHCSAENLG